MKLSRTIATHCVTNSAAAEIQNIPIHSNVLRQQRSSFILRLYASSSINSIATRARFAGKSHEVYYADEDTLVLTMRMSECTWFFCTSTGYGCVPRLRLLRAVNSTRVTRTRCFLRCCEGNICSRASTLSARASDVRIPQNWVLICPRLNATNATTELPYRWIHWVS